MENFSFGSVLPVFCNLYYVYSCGVFFNYYSGLLWMSCS